MEEIRVPLGDVAAASTRLERRNPLMGSGPAIRTLRNVNVPTMTVHLPPDGTATGVGVVVCPGGAWHALAIQHEGDDIAAALNQRGIAAFVVEYRLHPTPEDDAEASAHIMSALSGPDGIRGAVAGEYEDAAIGDVRRAVDLVRARGDEWGVRPDRVGLLGFSAGGHLVLQLALAGVPDFAAPIYAPVFEAPKAPADAPPLFVAVAADDVFGPLMVDGAIELARAWREAKRPVELHLYADGGHGFGSLSLGTTSDTWLEQAMRWIERTTSGS